MACVPIERKWFVLVTAFVGYASSIGLIISLSVLYYEWLMAFGRSKAETAVVQAVCNGIFNISGMAIGILVTSFGPRVIGMFCAVLSSLGFVLSYFATSITYLIIVFSVITGFGLGGMYICSAIAVGQYFDGKQKHMALSFMSFGGGVGGIFFTYILDVLCLEYTWKGCMLIVGGIILQNIPLFAICKEPVKRETKKDDINDEPPEEKGITVKLKEIFKNKLFYLNFFALCCIISSLFSSLIILLDFLQFQGFSRNDAVLLYLILTVVGAVSRLMPGILKQIPHVSIFAVALFHSLVGTVALFLFPSTKSFFVMAVLMGGVGFGIAGTLGSVLHISIIKVTGLENYSIGLGISSAFIGIFRLLSGPMTGYFRDITGSYDLSFYVNGAIGSCAVFCFVVLLYIHTSQMRTSAPNVVEIKSAEEIAEPSDNISSTDTSGVVQLTINSDPGQENPGFRL